MGWSPFWSAFFRTKRVCACGPFISIHEQEDTVDHLHNPLHLATEVGVPGRIHDVDEDSPSVHGRVLRADRDPLFSLQVHGVHDPFIDTLIIAESSALSQQLVNKGSFAMIDVGDDGDVTDVLGVHGSNKVHAREAHAKPLNVRFTPHRCERKNGSGRKNRLHHPLA